ncbi:MAG: TP0733 family outer membrane beta-barrel protein [Treponema sp.]
MKKFSKVLFAAFIALFTITSASNIYAQSPAVSAMDSDDEYTGDGDYYEDEEIRLTQNGAGDQFIALKLMPLIPLNFDKQLSVGGALSLGYHRFLTQFIAVGADVMFAYNTTIGSNLFTVIPLTVGITFQPYVWRFEFPITLNVGAALENYLQYNYFPGLILKAEAGCFYRMNENWSFGLECQLMYLPQWYSDSSKNDYYLGITATVGARYHF